MLSAVILSGGRSSRMGTDKAFLQHDSKSFISLIVDELLKFTDDVVITIGKKDKRDFECVLGDRRIKIVNDTEFFENPLGGMLSGLDHARGDYIFVIACDSPLIRGGLAKTLYAHALGHSAAIPIWDETDIMTCEPLCGVYNVEQTRASIARSIITQRMACKRMLALLKDVKYVPVSELRAIDPTMLSLLNINTPQDYEDMNARCQLAFV